MARWLVLTVRRSADDLDEVVAALLALGGTAVEEDGDLLRTWIPEPADPEAFMTRARAVLSMADSTRVSSSLVEDRDWLMEWRRGLGARRIGRRIIVTPTWIEPPRDPGDIVIALDPQMAFGTGEHATTRLMLGLMEPRVRAGDAVLDVGCGSGILAIAADLLGALRIDAVESDGDALPNAQDNVERNGAQRVHLHHALVDGDWLERAGTYDLIVANVLSGVLEPLLAPMRTAVQPTGSVILGGILRAEAEQMRAAAEAAGLAIDEERTEDEWWSVVLTST